MTHSEQVEPESQQQTSPSVGEQLKSARIAQGMDVQEVADGLHLDVTIISALESADEANLPAAIFVRGYIQSYARFIGVSAAPLLELYDEQAPIAPTLEIKSPKVRGQSSKPDQMMSFTRRSSSILPLVLILGVGLAGAAWWFWPMFTSLSSDYQLSFQSDDQLMALPVVVSEPTNTRDAAIDAPAVVSDVEPESSALIGVPLLSPAVEAEVATVEVLDRLVLSSDEESWVTISDATGKRVMYGLLVAGASREIEGVAPFKVLLGYALAAQLTINGEQYDIKPHIMKNSARFTVERL